MKTLFQFLLLFLGFTAFAQEDYLIEKFELPEAVKETSGLIFFNDKLITHNDSGDGPNLYEIDTISQTITRTITINNATNVDWEDMDQDDTYIYVGDIGNNSGDRQDLKIYRILKSDFINSNSVTADVISFSYEDQSDFTTQPNNTNFDAEAMTVYQDQIVIFSKNWTDQRTNAYIIPKTVGTHVAQKVSSFDSQGLITGAYVLGEHFLLTGYDTSAIPFLVFINENRPPGFDFFGGNPMRISLIDEIFLEQGSQIEGVCALMPYRWYISREFASVTSGTTTIEFAQKLYEFSSFVFFLLSTEDPEFSQNIQIVPNPVVSSFEIVQKENPESIRDMKLYNLNGQEMKVIRQNQGLNLESISSGIYLLQIQLESGKTAIKKVIKN